MGQLQEFAAYGWDLLPNEVLCLALSMHHWRSVQLPATPAQSEALPLLLIYNPNSTASLEMVHRARTEHPNAGIVLVTGKISETELLQFIEAGVSAYVGTHEPLAELLEAMRMTLESCSRSSGRMMRLVVENISRFSRGGLPEFSVPLTTREQEILSLLSRGFSNKEIASELSIAPNTVKHHVHNLLDKLRVKNRHEAAGLGIRPPSRKTGSN
jgi:DNA-binding NarL/FixJ family response regulator